MRPILTKDLDPKTFMGQFWLTNELIEFCEEHAINAEGSKWDVEKRIVEFLKK